MEYPLYVYAAGTLLALALYKVVAFAWRVVASPLRHLPGPPSESLFWGNMGVIQKEDNSVPQERWVKQYGPNIAYKGVFNMWRLWTVDTRALHHIVMHSDIYQRPASGRYQLSRLVGPGVLVTEEEQHRHQRRVMNPAFGPAQVRELTEVFMDVSNALRDIWQSEVAKAGEGPTVVDASSWLGRATLDIIGRAGFGYDFEALNPSGAANELNQAFATLFTMPVAPRDRFFAFLQATIPPLRIFKTAGNRKAEEAQKVMRRIGMQLIQQRKAAIQSEKGRGVERKDITERDLLTLLIRANMSTDIPENQRLSDDEVLAQVPTFIVAGHETTATATTWALFSLAQQPETARKLRDELLSVAKDSPDMDTLNALPYLDAVVRETLRHHSPVPMTTRAATADDAIPVSAPYTDRYGRTRDTIEIRKGDLVFIPILAINRSKAIWGEDADEFKPERWEHVPEGASSVPGVWGNVFSFLGGPRACIGYRFSLVETKALLFALVRAFEFELAIPADQIKKRSGIVTRPVVTDAEGKTKGSLPLVIRPYRA
ncbi:cytochrome P450 [Phanerochaete sordida]|uniref:Cytochrome P450 n=1 Tax=Phanerochaete sordida TaxID=48140 RepID=A0A9P3L6Y9_9APHY|nr:cytochrome P450 [Phanerochaete sordida]